MNTVSIIAIASLKTYFDGAERQRRSQVDDAPPDDQRKNRRIDDL